MAKIYKLVSVENMINIHRRGTQQIFKEKAYIMTT